MTIMSPTRKDASGVVDEFDKAAGVAKPTIYRLAMSAFKPGTIDAFRRLRANCGRRPLCPDGSQQWVPVTKR